MLYNHSAMEKEQVKEIINSPKLLPITWPEPAVVSVYRETVGHRHEWLSVFDHYDQAKVTFLWRLIYYKRGLKINFLMKDVKELLNLNVDFCI